MIRVPQVRVIDEEGQQLGVMATSDALRLGQERGYDLVEVAPMASPPVTRLLDYGQFKYEQTRREKEARRHQRSVDFKEIRLRVKIGTGDFGTKVRRAVQFLEAGGRVKVAVQFRGRELTHAYLGRDLLTRFAERVQDHGTVERQPLLEGKSMSIVLASTHRPGHAQRPDQAAEGEDVEAGAAPAAEQAASPAAEQATSPAPTASPTRKAKREPASQPATVPETGQAGQPAASPETEPAKPKRTPRPRTTKPKAQTGTESPAPPAAATAGE